MTGVDDTVNADFSLKPVLRAMKEIEGLRLERGLAL